MESVLVIELAIAFITIFAAAILGYRAQQTMGAVMLGVGALLASALCVAGTWIGQRLEGNTGAWIGLVVGVSLAGALAWGAGNKMVRGHAGRFATGLWLAYCALCIFGYLAGGWIGLLTITVPALFIFWVGMYRISTYILPLDEKKRQRRQAFRSLMTFTMGTNYPYYVVRQGEQDERVPGNPYSQFFAGPGIVLSDCDQVVYLSDGIKVKGLGRPGLTFTGMFDLPPRALDLRPQLRAFYVDAVTKDGIPIRVLTFLPFRVRRGPKEPQLGECMPFDQRAVFQIIATEVVQRRGGEGDKAKLKWDTDLVPLVATRIVQDIIADYTVDELCAADDPARDPRIEIVDRMKTRAKESMERYGIEVLGGGISNLIPLPRGVLMRRIENWQTRWEHQALLELSRGETERTSQIEQARARAEADVILNLSRIVDESVAMGTATNTALALRFIDCLGEMVSSAENQWPAPPALRETLDRLRGKLTSGRG